MKQEEWTKRLDQRMAGYQKQPSRDLWEGIESSLNKQEKAYARFVSLRRWAVAAVLAGLIFSGAYYFWQQPEPSHYEANVSRPAGKSVVTKEPVSLLPEKMEMTKLTAQVQKKMVTTVAEAPASAADPRKPEPVRQEEPALESVTSPQPTPSSQPAPSSQSRQKQPSPQTLHRQQRQLAMSLYASGGLSGWNGSNAVNMSAWPQQQVAASRGYLAGYEERQSHHQPVSFGMTVSYPLTRELSLSTGVVYTKLYSEFDYIMRSGQIHREQSLHYIGVPLNLHMKLWDWKGLKAYVSAGTQADWNVKVKSFTDNVSQEMSKDCTQWSVGGSLGIQYSIVPQVSIYAEPGIRHYFDNGSDVRNFFKDKPTNFSLQFGLRFNLSGE